MSEQHIEMTESKPVVLIPPDPVLALQFDGQGKCNKIAAASPLPKEQCWLHLDYSVASCQEWISKTSALPDVVRESLLGESTRPKLVKVNGGLLLTLRGINHNQGQRPDQMVSIRFFINADLIVSTRRRRVYAIEQIVRDLRQGTGPQSCADWLVDVCENLAEQTGDFVDELLERIVRLEDHILDQKLPDRRELVDIRRQLIVLRRYLAPQRDVYARLANEKITWIQPEDQRHLQDIADRMGRWLEDLDASIARTSLLADEMNAMIAESMNRRSYTMSVFAMVFLPLSFLTGLFGVNLGGIPGAASPSAFLIFCLLLGGGTLIVMLLLRLRRWL